MTWQIRFLANFVWENNAKSLIISHRSLLPICVGASQIEFEATIEIAFCNCLAVFSIVNFYATLQNEDFYVKYM